MWQFLTENWPWLLAVAFVVLVMVPLMVFGGAKQRARQRVGNWTSEGLGWVVVSARQPSKGECDRWHEMFAGNDPGKLQALEDYYQPFYRALEVLCKKHDVTLRERILLNGSAIVTGPIRRCQALQRELIKSQIASMGENTTCVTIASF